MLRKNFTLIFALTAGIFFSQCKARTESQESGLASNETQCHSQSGVASAEGRRNNRFSDADRICRSVSDCSFSGPMQRCYITKGQACAYYTPFARAEAQQTDRFDSGMRVCKLAHSGCEYIGSTRSCFESSPPPRPQPLQTGGTVAQPAPPLDGFSCTSCYPDQGTGYFFYKVYFRNDFVQEMRTAWTTKGQCEVARASNRRQCFVTYSGGSGPEPVTPPPGQQTTCSPDSDIYCQGKPVNGRCTVNFYAAVCRLDDQRTGTCKCLVQD